ncbi:peptide chain release factor N(5)-glutamine methyltransferase [Heliobacterium gestii]|uniref:Release factor glutamine methyltransferase n=1 Tax=Heliomicrobium gestii TaxID=2699 RepID=A0A845LE13_HELGE|nr:peptide chain release factor N(5)-glutamine methyltransferase [Heliomicrobium gestii]MBM7866550.1 release factor glutamine methyltransferase [Heliomicrobium gestii]MZP43170.1 peptide chain release factor N(5)-glutamine methyltransferase [Heliomicrobium gestii]
MNGFVWKPATVGEALQATVSFFARQGIDSPRLEAEVLLAFGLGVNRAGLLAALRDRLPEEQAAGLGELVQKRLTGCPLQYITGRQEFWGLDFTVTPAVLIPRPETELLVETALALLGRSPKTGDTWIADVGVGSGAIAVSVAREIATAQVLALDVSAAALAVARQNAKGHGVAERIRFVEGDLLNPAIDGGLRLKAVLSNPPYIPAGEIPSLQREVACFEPMLALDGGDDGLALYRRLAPQARRALEPGGFVAWEIGYNQGRDVAALLAAQGFAEVRIIPDGQGHDRVVTGVFRGECEDEGED